MEVVVKICKDCKIKKPVDQFYRNKLSKDGRLNYCKSCYFLLYKAKKDAYSRQCVQTLRAETFKHYGKFCFCCGESDIRFLTLDHSSNNGAIHRRGTGTRLIGKSLYRILKQSNWPQDLGLQVACWNCNSARHFNGGICPHEMVSREIAVLRLAA